MRRLPRIDLGSVARHLPLTEYAAFGLSEAFLLPNLEDRTERLADLLRDEPTVVLWLVCRSGAWDFQPPSGVASIAQWFAQQGIQLLRWSDTDLKTPAISEPDISDTWGKLAEDAVATGRCAEILAEDGDSGVAYLCGLLHNTVAWLENLGPRLKSVEQSGLPRWLTTWLMQIDEQPPASFAPGLVTRAKCRLTRDPIGNGEANSDLDDSTISSLRSAAAAVRERWNGVPGNASRLLPMLASELGRLQKLESDYQARLEQEKLDALKELAYGASHEINNPLANISTRAQTLMRDESDPDRRHKLSVINAQAFRAHEMIADMMLFARPPALDRADVELNELVDRVIHELHEDALAQGTALERLTAEEPLVVSADPEYLSVALKALCTNSLEALRRGGRIEIFVQSASNPTELDHTCRWVEILVSDNGPGITPEVRRHLFDPYFSGREAGRGLGLGLSKCWRIVTEHGGRIEVTSQPDRGTTFTILLPSEECANTLSAC